MVAISQNDYVSAPADVFSAEEQNFFIKEFGLDPVNDREPNELGFSYSAVIPLRIHQDIAERVSLRVIFNQDRKRLQLYLWYLESGEKIIDDHQLWGLRDLEKYIELTQILLKEGFQVQQGFVRIQKLLNWAETANFTRFGVKLAIYLFELFHDILRGLNSIDIAEMYRAPFKNGVFHPELVFELPPFYRFWDFYGTYHSIVFDSIELEFFRSLLRLAPAGWVKKNWKELNEVYSIETNLFGDASTYSRLPKSSQKKVLHFLIRRYRIFYCPALDKPEISITPRVNDGAEGVDTFRYEKVFKLNLVSIIIRYNSVFYGDSPSWEFIIFEIAGKQKIDIYRYNALFYWPRFGASILDPFELMEVYADALTQIQPQVILRTNASFMHEIKDRGLTGQEEPEEDLYFTCLHLEDPSSATLFLHRFVASVTIVAPSEWLLENNKLFSELYLTPDLFKINQSKSHVPKRKDIKEIKWFFNRNLFQIMEQSIVEVFRSREDLLKLAWDLHWKMVIAGRDWSLNSESLEWILAIVAEAEPAFDETVRIRLRRKVPTPACEENAQIHTFPLLLALLRDESKYPEGIVLEKEGFLIDMMRIRVDPSRRGEAAKRNRQEQPRRVYLDQEDGLRTSTFGVLTLIKKEWDTIWKIFCILDPD